MTWEPLKRAIPQKHRVGIGDPTTLRILALWQEKAREVLPLELFSAQAPKFFRRGILTIGVDNATVAGEINLRAYLLVEWINQKLKKEVVKKVVFKVR